MKGAEYGKADIHLGAGPAYEAPQKCVLRYGSEYYLLAVMGILFLVLWLAFFLSSPDINGALVQMMMEHEKEGRFAVLFAPVAGAAGLIALFIFCSTNKINLLLLTRGKDAFLDQLADMAEKYEILCVETGK